MDELEKTPSAQKPEGPELSEVAKAKEEEKLNSRRALINGFCGAYLLYLAWQLIEPLPKDVAAEGWNTMRILGVVAAVVFAVVGVLLLVNIAKRFYKQSKQAQQEAEEARRRALEEEDEEYDEGEE